MKQISSDKNVFLKYSYSQLKELLSPENLKALDPNIEIVTMNAHDEEPTIVCKFLKFTTIIINNDDNYIRIDNNKVNDDNSKVFCDKENKIAFYFDSNNNLTETKVFQDQEKGGYTQTLYDTSGNVKSKKFFFTNQEVLIDALTEDINYMDGIIPSTGKDLENHIENLKDFPPATLKLYKEKNGNSLIHDILLEVGLSSEKRVELAKRIVDISIDFVVEYFCSEDENVLNELENWRSQMYNEIDNFSVIKPLTSLKNTESIMDCGIISSAGQNYLITGGPHIDNKISNPYYEGIEYDVKIEGDIIKIKSKAENGENIELDLNKLVFGLPADRAFKLKLHLKQLPAEVLVDMYHEARFVQYDSFFKKDINSDAVGVYNNCDGIAFRDDPSLETIVHELGHAMDYMAVESFWGLGYENFTLDTFAKSGTAYETFEQEMADYIACEKQPYKGKIETEDRSYDSEEYNYCTKNIREMFAECYTLLMLGDCNSKDCILNHFPKTLENVKIYIEFIRSNSDDKRFHPTMMWSR